MKILPYNKFSKSARLLATELGVKRLRRQGRAVWGTVLNWGCSEHYRPIKGKWINLPHSVYKASNKLWALQAFSEAGVPSVEYTTSILEAARWLTGDSKVMVRRLLCSSGGKGAEVYSAGQELPQAPLYTKYFRRDAEYRVHVFNGEVIDYAQKKRKTGASAEMHIRVYNRGWVFTRNGVLLPDAVKLASVAAVKSLCLDFGAVDIGYRISTGKAAVFEVNTAPGIEGTTLKKYAAALKVLI